jgi:UDP-N-acetylmuramoyl-tripeptide--D-alanyl-D-alanine ligase
METTKITRLLDGVDIQYLNDRRALETGEIASISTDTRSLKEGEFFIAIRGERFDGHAFIPDALGKGCSGVLFEVGRGGERGFLNRKNPGRLLLGVRDTRSVFGTMARNYLRIHSPIKITVTGSVGKTTTTGMIRDVLGRRYRVVASGKSFNNDIGVPKTIFGVGPDTEMLVQEIGTNHPGEIANLTAIVEPDHALITEVGPSHLSFFGSEKNVAREKKDAVTALPSGGTAFLNAGGGYFRYLRRGIAARVRSFGLARGDLHPEKIIRVGLESSEFLLMGKKIRLPFIGFHSIINAVSAVLVALELGVDIEEALTGLESSTPRAGRGVVHHLAGGAVVIDESYNANPMSVSASLAYLGALPAEGKRIFVFGDMLELGDRADVYHRRVADQAAEKGVECMLTTGELAASTAERFGKRGYGWVCHCEHLEELAQRLRECMVSGDIVLVKASRKLMLERLVDALVADSG